MVINVCPLFAFSIKCICTITSACELPHLCLDGVHQSVLLRFLCALYEEVSPLSNITFPMDLYLESCRSKGTAFNKSHPHFEAALG